MNENTSEFIDVRVGAVNRNFTTGKQQMFRKLKNSLIQHDVTRFMCIRRLRNLSTPMESSVMGNVW